MSLCRTPGGCGHSDDEHRIPPVCDCLTARPDGCGQCVHCLRRVIHLMSPDNYKAAVTAMPELADQSIDWTYRLALVGPR